MGPRAAGGGRDALGPPRLHDPRPDVLVGPPRANRLGADAPRGNPRPHALDPPAELRNPGGLDERARADRRTDPGDPDREREVGMDALLRSEPEDRELIGPAEALPVVRDAFVRLARGEAILPGVIHLDVPNSGAEVHVKGA